MEEHVQPDWWRRIFNSLYLKTDSDVVEDEHITKAEMDNFSEILRLSQEEKILDLCCGQRRHSLELARRGFKNVEGLDRSHYLIQKAKSRAKKEGLYVKFTEGDTRKLPYPPDSFDVVMILGNSFGYFETIQDDLRVLKEVFRCLRPWGRVLIDVADGEHLRKNFQSRSREWIDENYFVLREHSLSLDKQRLISREMITHMKRGVVTDQFYAVKLYTRENLEEFQKTVGFTDIKFHEGISHDSQRNQDLGMMEKRLLVTALAKKEWTPVRSKKKGRTNVVVILGDPTKPDPLKPLGIFDEDDFYTIDQLKRALRKLEGYGFTLLTNHNTLISDLIKLKPKIDLVFNFCDKGFNNHPKYELLYQPCWKC